MKTYDEEFQNDQSVSHSDYYARKQKDKELVDSTQRKGIKIKKCPGVKSSVKDLTKEEREHLKSRIFRKHPSRHPESEKGIK